MVDQRIKDEISRLGFKDVLETEETVTFKNKNGSTFTLSQYKNQVGLTGVPASTSILVSMLVNQSFSKNEELDDVGRAILTLETLTDW